MGFVLRAIAAATVGLAAGPSPAPASPPAGQARFAAAVENIVALQRPGQIGLAAIWDGNKYIQCRQAGPAFLCEAAGARLQSSLSHELTPARVARLEALGWRPDPAFGAYVQTFRTSPAAVAEQAVRTLVEGYDADPADFQVESRWVADQPCPPRNGPSQNLAGLINDAPSMAPTAIHACAFYAEPDDETPATLDALIGAYGPRMTAELQRLRVNVGQQIHVGFSTDNGYVQCEPQTQPDALYCEAESADSWPALMGILTPDKVARLHAMGYADPGRAPNYWKLYPLATTDDHAIAVELLTILHDLYGYAGAPPLEIATEKAGT
jgi:hypothetical protein